MRTGATPMNAASIVVAVLLVFGTAPAAGTPADDVPAESLAALVARLRATPGVRRVEDWTFEEGRGLVFETRHYRVHTTLLDPLVLSSVPAFLEFAYRAYQQQLPEPVLSQFPFTVYLFATRPQWEAFTRGFTGDAAPAYLAIQKGAYYHNGACVVYHIGIHRTRSALGHEGWHQFVHRHFALRLPSWLDEGLATQFEVSQQSAGRIHFVPGRNLNRLVALRRAAEQDRLLSLPNLLAMNPGHVLGDDDRMAGFYAQVYALVRFLREADRGIYLGRFERLLHDARTGAWSLPEGIRRIAADRNIPLTADFNRAVSLALFRLYMGQSPEQLDTRYRAYCIELAHTVRIGESAP